VIDTDILDNSYPQNDGGLRLVQSEVLTSALVYWKVSSSLAMHPSPDLRYAWNLMVTALQEAFLAPNMATITAALLDLHGRPVYSMIGNNLSIGRTVSLAQSLGLNQDPSNWIIGEAEKSYRIRTWWGVLIHDTW
jgi:hypothetical protein